MAGYFSQCVVHPHLLPRDLSAAERLLMVHMFDHQEVDGELYFYAELCRHDLFHIDIEELCLAVAASGDSIATRLIGEALKREDASAGEIEIDVADQWIGMLQEIVLRSPTLTHIAIETAHSCSRMRPDGFGGSALLITAEAIDSMSTSQFIDEALARRLHGASDSSGEG